jgi:tyrosine-specific transport protein
MARASFEAAATLVGCTIGAGILGIPYVVAQAGFITGAITIILLGALMLMLNLFTGEIALRTEGDHQLPGYAERYLGKHGKRIMTAAMIFAIYGAILAYLIKSGEILSMLFGGSEFVHSIFFFSAIAFLIYLGPAIVRKSEIVMVSLYAVVIFVIFALSITRINPANLSTFSPEKLLMPYGVVIFALMGMIGIPEIKEEIRGHERALKKSIIIGSIIPIAVYFLFALSVVGVAGEFTSDAAVKSIWTYMGKNVGIAASVFAVLAMSTSFLALGLALSEMYVFDYNWSRLSAWFMTCFIPLGIFLFVHNFIEVLSITGAIADGTIAILLVLIFLSAKEKGDRKPEYSIKHAKAISAAILLVLTLGFVYEILKETGIIKI